MTIRTTTLPNHIRIVTDQLVGAESIALGVWVGVGQQLTQLKKWVSQFLN